ncbi:type II secretion system protein E [Halobiforma nitratireducens JCM 10879]|uniref:Type II secretion system protein E n=1 Tax=Halobiforma nitratireducens JCM 10879 TaxID=1227454 RepID=M0M678_9EURY|nr:type II secretion system protein E [Halobiforma nitratireducens JCM 10879]
MHADSVQTVINRLENEPINVPRPMVQSLDILSVQTLTRLGDGRARRNKVIAEIEGIDQRTGELDYSTAYTWDSETDSVRSSGSHVLSEIRDERGWSESELRTEVRNRERFLEYLWDNGITDYRRFTALVNEYYADRDRVLEAIEEVTDPETKGNAEGESRAGDSDVDAEHEHEPKYESTPESEAGIGSEDTGSETGTGAQTQTDGGDRGNAAFDTEDRGRR